MSENGQGIQVDPQRVIDRLLHRLSQLELEVALKDAHIAALTEDREEATDVAEQPA